MTKPLLTDTALRKAQLASSTDKKEEQQAKDQKPFVKSRRIERAKRLAFRQKINRILLFVGLLLVLLIWAIIYL